VSLREQRTISFAQTPTNRHSGRWVKGNWNAAEKNFRAPREFKLRRSIAIFLPPPLLVCVWVCVVLFSVAGEDGVVCVRGVDVWWVVLCFFFFFVFFVVFLCLERYGAEP